MMGAPILQPTTTQTAAALTNAASTLAGTTTAIPAPWVTLMAGTWTRLSAILLAGTFADHDDEAELAIRLARAGCHACMVAAREASESAIYPAMVAGNAHRHSWTALAIGWPNRRTTRTNLPIELANVRSAERRALTTGDAERYIAILLQDPLGLSWASAKTAMTAIPAGAFTGG